MKRYIFFVICLLVCAAQSCSPSKSKGNLVRTMDDFNNAVKDSKPGDVITLANGIWKDAELLFEGNGTDEKPITLTVEEKGKVFLEGASNLRIAGSHLVVEGLVFRNGFTPTGSVISFKKDDEHLANNCRLTECVIDNYSNPDRFEQDYWVALYGKNNRVDHNHLEGKRNLGVTMAVRLTTKESQENNHQIDHNYFGPRPTFGSNGGETLRIGTSHFSMTNSKTLVSSNYFDRCDGEHEIISNKSCQNIYNYNTFFECAGTLTMRHGNETLVDGNVFIGNGKPRTGGIRIINEKQTVVNNYAYGLTGYRFRGALVIMNGVPNSPINRYFQVDSAVVRNNTFVDCDFIQLDAGSDSERSAVPINSLMEDNIFYNIKKDSIFTIYDDISGITFKDNLISPNIVTGISTGFKKTDMKLVKNAMGLPIPESPEIKRPVTIDPNVATKENTGVSWYSKKDKDVKLGSGKMVKVAAGMNTLYDAAKNSSPGDILELASGETYEMTKSIAIDHPLTFKSDGKGKSILLFAKNSLFDIQNGGSLALEGLKFDGKSAPDYSGNSVIRTSKYSMNRNYKLFIDNCDFVDLDMNHSFDVFQVAKSTFADTISIKNSYFKNITGHVLELNKETDDIGIYNAEYVILKNNVFSDIGGSVLNLYRGGTDESTYGPFLEVDHCVFDNVGQGSRNKDGSAISLYGVQVIDIKNSIFSQSKGVNVHLVVGGPVVHIENNDFYNSDGLKVTGDEKYHTKNLWHMSPDFSKDSFSLGADSPLKGKGTDGQDLGTLSTKL